MKAFFICFFCTLLLAVSVLGQVDQSRNLIPPRERAELQNRLLKERFETLLPRLMKESGIDCWLVICREYNEDPVFYSLMPAGTLSARRLTMLVFFLDETGKTERVSISPYDIADLYKGVWRKGEEEQWPAPIRVIAEKNPRSIAVNRSRYYAHADGLSAFLQQELMGHMPGKLKERVRDAEALSVRWLETRLPSEESVFRQAVAFTRDLIARAFSSQVIKPGLTTVDDLQWWMKTEMDKAGVVPWFFPHVDRKGREDKDVANDGVIMSGDFLHCDVGIVYMGLCSDVQELAYVCRDGELDAPDDLKAGLKAANDFQDIVMNELLIGRSGNEILTAALARAKMSGLDGFSLYSHPLGLHGHAAGPTIGMWDNQKALLGHGDWRLHTDTAYALELNVSRTVPGWAGQIRFGLEQDIWVGVKGNRYIAGRQNCYHIIRLE